LVINRKIISGPIPTGQPMVMPISPTLPEEKYFAICLFCIINPNTWKKKSPGLLYIL